MCAGPEPFPKDFREDVIRVARDPEPDQTIKRITTDFGISESCLNNWLTKADIEDGAKPGTTAAERADLREAGSRFRLLKQENEVLRQAAAYLNRPGSSGGSEVPKG